MRFDKKFTHVVIRTLTTPVTARNKYAIASLLRNKQTGDLNNSASCIDVNAKHNIDLGKYILEKLYFKSVPDGEYFFHSNWSFYFFFMGHPNINFVSLVQVVYIPPS